MNGTNDLESSYPAPPPGPEDMFTGSSSGMSTDDERPGLDNGHSLPNVDELKTDAKAKGSAYVGEDGEVVGRRTGGWVFWVALFLALVVIGAIIGIAVAVTSNSSSPSTASSSSLQSSAPQAIDTKPTDSDKETGTDVTTVAPAPATTAPAPAPSGDRTALIKSYLTQQGISSDADLSTEGSPQQQALDFLAVRDGYAMDIPTGSKDTPEGYAFMTRYVLSTLFFSTRGSAWTFDLNFLKPVGTCAWYSVLQYVDMSTEYRGVACDEENNHIVALFMSKESNRRTFYSLFLFAQHRCA